MFAWLGLPMQPAREETAMTKTHRPVNEQREDASLFLWSWVIDALLAIAIWSLEFVGLLRVVFLISPPPLRLRRPVEDLVGTSVLHRLFGEEPLVAVEVAVDLLGRLARPLAHQLIHPVAQADHVRRLDPQIGRRPLQH